MRSVEILKSVFLWLMGVLIALAIGLLFFQPTSQAITETQGTIIALESDTFYIEDTTGEVWCWQNHEPTDLQVGDKVRFTRDNRGTEIIYDDEIIEIHKS